MSPVIGCFAAAALAAAFASPSAKSEPSLVGFDVAAAVRRAEFEARRDNVHRPAPIDSGTAADPAQVRFRTRALLAGGVAGVAAYGAAEWWRDGLGREFKAKREGWFGKDTPSGGMDKLGHAYFTYAGSRLLAWGLEAVGNDQRTALETSLVAVFGTLTGIEVIDGFSRRFAFSWEDAVMNAAGAAGAWLFETNAELDAIVDLRFGRAPDASLRTDRLIVVGDYPRQAYFAVAKASGVPALNGIPVVRYLELTLGYNARGFDGPRVNPERRLLFGVSLNLGSLLEDTLLRGAGPRTLTVSRNFFEFVQVPGTQLLAERRY